MQWQLAIHIKLNLDANTPKVITDHTGILTSSSFLTWLSERKTSYAIATSTADLMAFTAQMDLLNIITPKSDIPAFITNKWTHKTFSWSDVPFNGNAHMALKNLSGEQLSNLLDAIYEADRHQVINETDIPKWLEIASNRTSQRKIESLQKAIQTAISEPTTIESIFTVGKYWGELIYLNYQTKSKQNKELQTEIDLWSQAFFFANGMEKVMFASTPKSPKSVDRILPNIKTSQNDKIALICFDCMGWAEWLLLKDYLKDEAITFQEDTLLAMLPSVTAISRSAIFQGSRDVYNLKSPGRATEAKSFTAFFENKHTKYFTDKDEITSDALLGYDAVSVLFTFYDDLGHSTHFAPHEDSKEPYFDAVWRYLEKSTVKDDIKTLLQNGYSIFICSDHGSVVAVGNGQKLEKYLMDSFAKRAAIVPSDAVSHIKQQTLKIPFVDDKVLALPEERTMYANMGTIEVNHGGITLEEMVVPYIKISNG
jgi:hypothetical protein